MVSYDRVLKISKKADILISLSISVNEVFLEKYNMNRFRKLFSCIQIKYAYVKRCI